MPQIVVLGEALFDLFAEKGKSLRAVQSLYPAPGGAPANVAVAAARLGAKVGFIGKVGLDDFGSALIDLLAGEGVDTAHFVADRQAPTMLALVAAPNPEEQHFIVYMGASGLLAVDEMPREYIVSASVFVFGSATLASSSREATIQAARWAREAGKHVIFDVNLRPTLWLELEVARQHIEESIVATTVVKLNERELKFLTGLSDPAQGSQQIIDRGVQLCCVSLGADGAYFNNGSVHGHVPAFKVQVVDTTGSGDAFVAGLAYQLSHLNNPLSDLDEETLRKMVAFANGCGALASTGLGAMSALPSYEVVQNLIRNNITLP